MTQYMLAVIHDWDGPPMGEENMQKAFEQVSAFNEEITANGKWVFGGGLTHPSSATVVRSENDETVLTDGPYLEAKEYLGSFDIIDVDSYERAIEIATAVPFAKYGSVEIRPLMDESASNE